MLTVKAHCSSSSAQEVSVLIVADLQLKYT